ncbi:MAG: radical SAM protein [Thermoplasmatales archaeon]|nr:MAG: radical SAM protein [Thermoplasmatales archaeon]
MKFLLIRPGDRESDKKHLTLEPSTVPPLGLLYLGAALEQHGHNVEILDYYMENLSREKLKNTLLSSDAVGMTICTEDFKPHRDISRMIKDLDPDIPLIIGGPHCTYVKERSLQDIPLANISVVGEGEHVILDLASFLQGKKNLANIQGIHYRNNGSITSGKPLQVINNLDDVPFPARHLTEKYEYGDFPFGFQLKKKVTSTITSRGCPFHCRFCTRYANVVDGWGFRQRSARNILQEFAEIDEKYHSINIVDDTFLADKKRAHKIFDGLIEMGRELELVIHGARVDSADKELYQKMKKAGVKYIYFGLESGNQDVLDYYNKNITLSQIKQAVNLSRKMNFITIGNFIFGAPMETKEHIENTIKFACSLPLDIAGFGPLIYILGSELWNEAVESKKISKDMDVVFADSEKGLGNFTKKELIEYTIIAFQRFYYRPSYLLSQIYRSISRNDYSLLFYGLKLLFSLKKELSIIPKIHINGN